MKAQTVRLVLGFYATDEGGAEKAYRDIRSAKLGRVSLFLANNVTTTAFRAAQRYAALRLDGESLVVVAAEAANVRVIVNTLRSSGSPAIFVLREIALHSRACQPDDSCVRTEIDLFKLFRFKSEIFLSAGNIIGKRTCCAKNIYEGSVEGRCRLQTE